ncbi:MAG: MFS transporter [Chromatiales bacterium]|nr:MAG: MFS transporter [Chromatiales bacterium]
MRNRSPDLLPVSTYFGYGVGQIGGQILRDTPALILPFYMATVVGLDARLGGLVILIAKVWAVIADPLAGLVSDKSETRWGRRRPFILAGGLLAALCFMLLFFVPPTNSQNVLFLYLTAVYVVLNTGYSLFSVPYLTMASEMSANPDERTTIMSFRNAFLGVGLIVVALTLPILFWLQESGASAREAYERMGLLVGLVIAMSTLSVFFGTARAPAKAATAATVPLGEQLRIAWANKPFVVLIAANIVQYISAGIGYAGGLFFFSLTMDLGQEALNVVTVWLIIISVASMAAMPLLVWAAARLGKMTVYKWCLVLYAISIQFYFTADKDSLWIVWLIAIAIGLFNGGFILMSFSVLTDVIHYDRIRTSISREGVLSSVYSAVDKVGNALGGVLFMFFLSLIGFVESADGQMAGQTPVVIRGIGIAYIVAPAVLHVSSIFILNRYKLSSVDLREPT